MTTKYPPEFLERLKSVKGKRARCVIEHILTHGQITTDDLRDTYGYKHPPRAPRDVRERGVELKTIAIKSADGRSIAAYVFDVEATVNQRLHGRHTFTKAFKLALVKDYGLKCAVCGQSYEARYLQIDHRVPYAVAGDVGAERKTTDYMLLCASCNRAKSWSCEHCANWSDGKSESVCQSCYWAQPAFYKHIALRKIRRLDIVWTEDEVRVFDKLKTIAETSRASMPEYVKAIVKKHIDE